MDRYVRPTRCVVPASGPAAPAQAFLIAAITYNVLLASPETVAAAPQESGAALTLDTPQLLVTVDPSNGTFSAKSLPDGKTYLPKAAFATGGGTAVRHAVQDKVFGAGESIVVTAADGSSSHVTVFPGQPFVFCKSTLHNAGDEAKVLNRVPVVTFDLGLEKSAAELKAMGSGGLATLAQAEGSYVWLAVADPTTRAGVVAGWLTHDRASGVLFPKIDGDVVRVEARGDYGRLRIGAGQSADTETVLVGHFADARLGLEQWADAVARQYDIKLRPQPNGYCTWYSDKNGRAGNETSLPELTEFAAKHLKPYGFDFVQIDDYWQAGEKAKGTPKKDFTTHDPDGPYPSGMKQTADMIKGHGLTPGLWFMPFSGDPATPFFADKQHLFAKDDKGELYFAKWGGTPFDMTKPAAQDYVRSYVTRMAKDWGYRYFKMDGLWAGVVARQNYVNGKYKEDQFGDAVLENPDKTNVEAYRDGVKLVRDAAGPDVFFLGCTMAQNMRMFGASFGLFDAMRVGPDNGGTWKNWSVSPKTASWQYFLNGRIWYNDPDPLYVRATAGKTVLEEPNTADPTGRPTTREVLKAITDDEARTIASWHAVCGQLYTASDWLPALPPARLDILRRTMPAHGKTARPVDYFENDPPRLWTVTDERSTPRRDVIALFNWADTDQTFDVPLARFGLPAGRAYAAFDFWANAFVALDGGVKTTIVPHGCRVLAVRAVGDHPVLLSTSRHVTQGMVEVREERWDAAAKTLHGRSDVVGGDPYELRFATPPGGRAVRVAVSEPDAAAGVTIKLTAATDGIRVAIDTATGRSVQWSVSFE